MAATRLIAMHISKGWTIQDSIKAKTDYAENPEKTVGKELVSSYACSTEAVAEEFLLSYKEYEKRARRKYDHEVIAYQIRQSFKPGEVTPEEANRIGYETAMRFTKGNHAFIVATHTDRAHIHNHVVFCASNIKHTKKFRDFHKSGLALQKVSDLICLEHGLSVISPRPYNEREKRTVFPQREAFRDVIRESIDMALSKRPKDFDDFLLELRAAGYEIKRGKHTAIRGRGQKRFIRFRSLGEGYTEAEIKNKIGCISPDKNPNKSVKAKSDEKFDLLLSLQDVIAKGKGPGYELWAKKYNVKNVMKAILFFQEQGLRTYEELAEKAESSASRYYKYKLMKKSERIELLEWLRSRPLSTKVEVNETTFVLTHSFFKVDKFDVPYSEIDYQTAWDIVWDSPFRWDSYMDNREYSQYEPWLFVIGHVPTCHADEAEGYRPLSTYREDNIIDIDGGCAHHDNEDKYFKGGIMLRLDDMKEFTITFDELEKMK